MIVAGPDAGHVLIQVTTRGCMSARRSKICGKPQHGDGKPDVMAAYRLRCLLAWLGSGGRVLVQGWAQPGGTGTRHHMTEWEVTADDAKRFNGS